MAERDRTRLWIGLGVAAVALIGLTWVALELTARPSFCASCHEMRSSVQGWREGSHAENDCLDCHADPGVVGYLEAHVADGLRDVWIHFTQRPDTIRIPAEMSPARCLRCHEDEYRDEEVPSDHPDRDSDCTECHGEGIHPGPPE